MKRKRIALLFYQSGINSTLSYQHGWPKAFLESPLFECESFNLADAGLLDSLAMAAALRRGRFDAIVMLHSVYSNQKALRGPMYWAVATARQPKAYFIGNEYKLMPEKMAFCRRLGISLLISQSNDERVLGMYREALGCAVACVPNTGCDTSVFQPRMPLAERPIDIGYRAYGAPLYLGNDEKAEIARFFLDFAPRHGLSIDISMDPERRFDAVGYAHFLNQCRGQIGTESGGDFFELTDDVRMRVWTYTREHPGAEWPAIKAEFFDRYGPSVPMRIISGRQVEAAACKTVQILFSGRYNGYFEPDVHYLPLDKDFGNAGEVLEKFNDLAYCERIVENAYQVAMGELTYDRLVGNFAMILNQVA